MFTPMETTFVMLGAVLALIVFAAITGYLEGAGRRVVPRPTRPRLPRPRRRLPKVTATVWGTAPCRRALPPAVRRPMPAAALAPLALPATRLSAPAAEQVITGEIVR